MLHTQGDIAPSLRIIDIPASGPDRIGCLVLAARLHLPHRPHAPAAGARAAGNEERMATHHEVRLLLLCSNNRALSPCEMNKKTRRKANRSCATCACSICAVHFSPQMPTARFRRTLRPASAQRARLRRIRPRRGQCNNNNNNNSQGRRV